MSSELAMNAYVLLGNALHYFLNVIGAPSESGIGSASIRELYSKIEQQPPSRILEAVAALTFDERKLMGDVCRYVSESASGETETVIGLPQEVIHETMAELGL